MKYLGKIQDPKDLVTKEYVDNGHILNTKTYTGVIGTANDWANATFFFGVVKPTDYNTHWKIRYRVYAQAAGDYRAQATSDFTLNGINSTYITYKAYNSIINTSYRPAYYHVYYRATSAGMTYGHAMGIRLYSSWNPTTAANARTIKIEILEVENCTFTFFNSMTKYASIPGTGSTNYAGYTEFDFASSGLQETGDSNTTSQLNNPYQVVKTGTNGIFPYTFIMQKLDGTWESNVTSSSTGNKSVNTSGFLPDSIHWYYNSTTREAGANVPTSCISELCDLRDMRYPLNGITTTASTSAIHANSPLYLVGTITNGLFYFDTSSWFSESLPSTDNGKVYILVGVTYDAYRTQLYANHPMYWYKNGAVRLYGDYGVSGIVSSVAATGSGGITISGSPITSSGTLTIGVNGSTVIKNLSEGTSPAQRNDYIVAQYAGGGTTTTSYHRRKLSNIFAALNSSDITTALGYTPPTTDHTYNFSGTTFYSGNSGTAEHNANSAVKNGNYYYSSNGPATSLGASTADGALYVQSYSDSWVGQIAQDYRNGGLFVRGKNNGTWQSWQQVYDTGHTIKLNSNNLPQFSGAPAYLLGIDAFADGGTMKWQGVGSVSVGYATSAGNASTVNSHSVAVDVPSGAKFTDTVTTATTTGSGNAVTAISASNGALTVTKGSTFLTGITSSNVTTALGYTPLTPNFVTGTQTAATNVWTGNLPSGVTDYYNGLTIDYFLPFAGTSTGATLNLSSKGAKPVYIGNGTSAVTTHYPAYSVIRLTYVVDSHLNSGNGCWKVTAYQNSTYYYESTYVTTASATAAKVGTCSNYGLAVGHLQVLLMNANTYAGAITLNINGTGAKPVYINGAASSSSNYSLPKAMYLVYYDGTNFYFRTDGKITGDITGNAGSATFADCNFTTFTDGAIIINKTITLVAGALIYIRFTNTTQGTASASSANAKLNVGNTGGIPIRYWGWSSGGLSDTSFTQTNAVRAFSNNRTYGFVYTGAAWYIIGSMDTNTTYSSGTDAELTAGTVTNTRVWTPKILHDYIESHGGSSATTLTVTLAASSWSNGQQTVTATGVTASNTVLVSPAPASYNLYSMSGVYCSAQAANSLTFTCASVPGSAITVNVLIM